MDPTGFVFVFFFIFLIVPLLVSGVAVDPDEIYFSQKTVGARFHVPNDDFHGALSACGVAFEDGVDGAPRTAALADVVPTLVGDGGGCNTQEKKTALIAQIRLRTALDAIDWGEGANPRYTSESNRRLVLARRWKAQLTDSKVTVNPVLPASVVDFDGARYVKIICISSDSEHQVDPAGFQCLQYTPTNWGQAITLRSLTNGLAQNGATDLPVVGGGAGDCKVQDFKITGSCKDRVTGRTNAVGEAARWGQAEITHVYVPQINNIQKVYKVARAAIGDALVTAAFADGNTRYSCAKSAAFLEMLANKKGQAEEQERLTPLSLDEEN